MIVVNDKLSVKQCADDAGVSTMTIYNWIASGELKAQKFGPKTTRIAYNEWKRFKAARDAAGAA